MVLRYCHRVNQFNVPRAIFLENCNFNYLPGWAEKEWVACWLTGWLGLVGSGTDMV